MELTNPSSELIITSTDEAIAHIRDRINPPHQETLYDSDGSEVGTLSMWKVVKDPYIFSICLGQKEDIEEWWSGKHHAESLPEPIKQKNNPDAYTDYLVEWSRIRHDSFAELEEWLRSELAHSHGRHRYSLERRFENINNMNETRSVNVDLIADTTGIDRETIIRIGVDHLGYPIAGSDNTFYFHGLQNNNNLLSLAVKFCSEDESWYFVRLDERQRDFYENIYTGRSHWSESIESPWEKAAPERLGEIIQAMRLAGGLV